MACSNTINTCTNCNHSCSTCNNNCPKCGCKDAFLTTPPPCPTPAGCPDPPACSEVLDANCVIYSGPGITCGDDTVVVPDTSVMDALEDIVQYFCNFNPAIPEITCGSDIVIDADSTIVEAFEAVVDYFCTAISSLVPITANNGLTMSTVTNVQWGGTLIQNTTITQNAYTTLFTASPAAFTSAITVLVTGSNAGTNGINIRNLVSDPTSVGQNIGGGAGTGLIVVTDNATINPALYATANESTLGNVINDVIKLYGKTSTAALPGTGSAASFTFTDDAGSETAAGKMGYQATSVTSAGDAQSTKFFLTTKTAGTVTPDTKLEVSSVGQARLNKYGIGTFTGTPTFNLMTTATGQVIEQTAGLFGTAFRAAAAPSPPNINSVTQTLTNSRIGAGVTIIPSLIYEITNGVATTTQYNAVTGVWTCPQTGKYDLNYNLYLTSSDDETGWGYSTLDSGYIQIGITDPTGAASIYNADIITIIKDLPLKVAYTTGCLQGVTISAGTQLVLKVLNFTNQNYISVYGDNIDWSIRRVG
jgi:hypothetical protein